MQTVADSVTDLDLQAYVDDQLDDWQRLRVETHLARDPQTAAQVMQDIRLRRELRLALTPSAPPPPQARIAAGRLSRALRHRDRMRKLMRVVPVASLVAVGWLAHAGFGPLSVTPGVAAMPPPPMVQAAIAARQVSLMRLPMQSQIASRDLDPAEIRASTGILLPCFQSTWQLQDAQVFPSPQGPGVELVFQDAELGRLTHFAVRTGHFAVTLPQTERHGQDSIAWFQIGETAHVLIADKASPERLADTARTLSETLY